MRRADDPPPVPQLPPQLPPPVPPSVPPSLLERFSAEKAANVENGGSRKDGDEEKRAKSPPGIPALHAWPEFPEFEVEEENNGDARIEGDDNDDKVRSKDEETETEASYFEHEDSRAKGTRKRRSLEDEVSMLREKTRAQHKEIRFVKRLIVIHSIFFKWKVWHLSRKLEKAQMKMEDERHQIAKQIVKATSKLRQQGDFSFFDIS